VKQIVLRDGQPQVVDVPAPSPQPGSALVNVRVSVISSGTERQAVSTSAAGGSLPMRAVRNPGLVVMALKHAREHGVRETAALAKAAVSNDVPLGYACAGHVIDTGGIPEFQVGQPVACAGAGKANHAEVVSVPGNLLAPVPAGVSLRDAAFTTLGAIALQGVRRAEPSLGERVVVSGLGLLGLLTVQLLRAGGCQVLGIEPVARRRAIALDLGTELAVAPDYAGEAVGVWSGGHGADAVIITASASSDSVVNDAIALLRRKGRVVPVGLVGLSLDRDSLYQREADVLISTSYGPGRYDLLYEEGGLDYPIAYVRWTENRNMEEFLRLLSNGAVRVDPLVELEVPVARAPEAYAAVRSDEPPMAAVLTYERDRDAHAPEVVAIPRSDPVPGGALAIAIVGAGSFVRGVHLPNLKADPRVRVKVVVTRRSTTATDVVRGLGGGEAATDWRVAVDDPEVQLVIIGTRHDTHAEIAAAALGAGKAVFVEKPLGLSWEQIDEVWWAGGGDADARLAIGFNRPFAPLAIELADRVAAEHGPIHLIYRVNAPLRPEHWLNDPREGGGRLQGEACHMFDFANHVCGTPVRVIAASLPTGPDLASPESASVTVQYEDGSVATVHYSGAGAASMPKERIEVLRGGRSWVLDDFERLSSYGPGDVQQSENRHGDKGHGALLAAVLAAARDEASLFRPGLVEAYAAQAVALSALESIATGRTIEVRMPVRRDSVRLSPGAQPQASGQRPASEGASRGAR
jgi:predicted dehydrogenase/threonine dehydrogenase-like Zn-dependent dehydrogenase